MKERLLEIVQKVIQTAKDRVAAIIEHLKTPKGRKKGFAVLACIFLIGIGFLGHSIYQKRQASYTVEGINAALHRKDLRGLLRYFVMTDVINDFIQELLPLQADFVHKTREHVPIDEKAFTEKANALFLDVAMATFKPGDAPEGDAPEGDDPEGDAPEGDAPEGDVPEGDAPEGDAPEGDAPEGDVPEGDDPKTPQEQHQLLKPYTPFSMPTLFPVEILRTLAESSFTLHPQEDGAATISIPFTHPTLGIQISLKFLMERDLLGWSVKHMSNAGLVTQQLAGAVRAKKDAAIEAFDARNKQVEKVFDLHFEVLRCDVMVAQEHHPDDLTIFVNAEVENKGQASIRALSLELALFTQQGLYIGSLPADFGKSLPAKSKDTQSWRRTIESARKDYPLLFKLEPLRCTIKPKRILFEDDQSITFLPDRLLNGL